MAAKKPQAVVAFRLSAELLKRLDRHAGRLGRQHPGLTFGRTDALRELVTRALDQAEAAERAAGRE